jgi:SNF2 family DNA or RNA helicase
MGLGKTIQSLSLILTNPRPSNEELEHDKKTKISKDSSKATLVVAPLALIRQWEAEINSKSDGLKIRIHHGASRTKSATLLQSNDVVITTYQTLTSEHAAAGSDIGPNSGCFGVYWYRIILDEAHTIKNSRAKCTQAAYNLRSVYRWCLTGTPVQNNLDELQSLIRFLQIKPYNDHQMWKQQITAPMKNGRGGLAVRRLQAFLRACMKRRTKDVLKKDGAFGEGENSGGFQLMERNVQIIAAEFDHRERKFYDSLETRLQDNLAELMLDGKQDYIGALVLLLRLRQACNHPHLLRKKMEKDRDALATGLTDKATLKPDETEKEVDDLADMMGGLSVQIKKCDLCKTKLTATEAQGQLRCTACEQDLKSMGESTDAPRKTKEKKSKSDTIQERLKRRAAKNRRAILDSDDERDEDAEDSWKEAADGSEEEGEEDDEDSDSSDDSEAHAAKARPKPGVTSTKINHLLDILEKETPHHKVIVFSQFTSMLDIIQPFLVSEGYKFVRYDGSMKNGDREASLSKLRNDKRTKVLLCSLKCGSLGLNLTAASRVVLVEPFWNPVSTVPTPF